MFRRLLPVFLILSLLSLGSLYVSMEDSATQPAMSSGPAPTAVRSTRGHPSLANFQAVREGMSTQDVFTLLGPPTTTMYENVAPAPLPSSGYTWRLSQPGLDGYIQAQFEHNRLIAKSQWGLH